VVLLYILEEALLKLDTKGILKTRKCSLPIVFGFQLNGEIMRQFDDAIIGSMTV